MKGPRGCSDRAMTSNCVRFDDRRGWSCRLNKTGLRSQVKKKLFSYYIKRYEQKCRGEPESAVLKKFEMFRRVAKSFPSLKALPAGFERWGPVQKQATLLQLVTDQLDDAERIYLQFQVGEANLPDPALEVVAKPSPPPDDVFVQNGSLGIVHSEGSPGDPPGYTLHLGSFSVNQLDNPEGRPPPSSRQDLDELNQVMSGILHRASRYPDISPEIETLKQRLFLLVKELDDREMNENVFLESRSNLLRASLEEIPSRLPEGISTAYPQNLLQTHPSSKTSMEGVGFQDCDYPASDFSGKNIETPLPDGEEDGLLRNRSISEALAVVPRLTGRLKKNIGDIRPEVYGDSADGDLPDKPIMEGFSAYASDFEVSDLCCGGEDFMTMHNPGGNNTLQSFAIDHFFSAEPPANDLYQWAERQLRQFDSPDCEISPWSYLGCSPISHLSIDTLPA